MRVAALYDIHGNLPALEAVLRDVRAARVDRVVVGGDVVPGPMPLECLAALNALPLPVLHVYGNGERDVLAVAEGEMPARVPAAFHEAMRWVAAELAGEPLTEIARWPATCRLEVTGLGDTLFCHATPRDENGIFTRATPEERLTGMFEETGADLVVCGHTHMPFDRRVGGVRVVNAGSVGLPFGEPGAWWALLGAGVELRCTEYDRAAATALLAGTGYPGAGELPLLEPPAEAVMLEMFEAAALPPSGGQAET